MAHSEKAWGIGQGVKRHGTFSQQPRDKLETGGQLAAGRKKISYTQNHCQILQAGCCLLIIAAKLAQQANWLKRWRAQSELGFRIAECGFRIEGFSLWIENFKIPNSKLEMCLLTSAPCEALVANGFFPKHRD
jgi:hypothetical protein